MTARSYIVRSVLFTLVAIVVVAGINFIVDPYLITGMPRISNFNEYKVDIGKQLRMTKKYHPLKEQYNTLILGTSRAETGINPAHQCLQDAGMKAYNLGIPGANVQTQLAYALNLVYQQRISTAFLSLDFTDFIWTRNRDRFDAPSLLEYRVGGLRFSASGEPDSTYLRVRLRDYFRSLFSLDSLVSSLKTFALQGRATSDRDDAGFNPARDFEEIVRIEGTHALFDQKMKDLEDHFSPRWYLSDAEGRLDPAFDDLKVFLDIAAERQIKIYLFINPFHESYWDLLRAKGHMHLHVEWLEAFKTLLGNYTGNSVVLWDFSVESSYIQEAIPDAGQSSGPLQWFWEPSFYRQQLGDLMIEAMMSDTCGTEVAFGHRIQ